MKRQIKGIFLIMAVLMILMLSSVTVSAKTVAKIGNKSYSGLASAYKAAKNGQTIKLTQNMTWKDLDDVSHGLNFSMHEKKRVILDMNKKTIDGTRSENSSTLYIFGGSITIKNGTMKNLGLFCYSGSKMILNNVKYNGNKNVDITNSGTMSITNCVLKTSRTDRALINSSGTLTLKNTQCSGSYPWLTNGQYMILLHSGSKTTINGGSYSAGNGFLLSVSGGGGSSSLVIKGGTFKGKIANLCETKIYKGTFKMSKEQTIVNSGVMKIYGGTFTSSSSCVLMNNQDLTISGGTFKATGRLRKYSVDGYNTEPGTISQGSSIAKLILKKGTIYSKYVSGIYSVYGTVNKTGGTVKTDSTDKKYPAIKTAA